MRAIGSVATNLSLDWYHSPVPSFRTLLQDRAHDMRRVDHLCTRLALPREPASGAAYLIW